MVQWYVSPCGQYITLCEPQFKPDGWVEGRDE
ncbi:hypothetical protein ACHELOUS_114 [Vibrio phage Achelous]|uniref:Uncharacterized protein n=2 Tax=Thalassavirus TaxID=2948922 RepID=A0A4Y6E8J4_9CAUD|nr:hypothetical protein KNU52_gp174 [Vibrio phage Achelous]YP_010102533.1 hypothetical protein KNU58_gp172 [Vibrio phage Brizo]QCQ57696.1 hypothetical protein ACHELOUS_114 [Vibrio phage Achelous]QDF14511.1 hypothetical protein BRIZO_107 [Vibrio phage Brizo]WBU76336.1 hypothetical protein WYMAN_114 [Vibrio phage Wyman]